MLVLRRGVYLIGAAEATTCPGRRTPRGMPSPYDEALCAAELVTLVPVRVDGLILRWVSARIAAPFSYLRAEGPGDAILPRPVSRPRTMPFDNFDQVQRAVLAQQPTPAVLELLPAGSRLVSGAPCPSCHARYVAQLPDLGEGLICLACGLEFEP